VTTVTDILFGKRARGSRGACDNVHQCRNQPLQLLEIMGYCMKSASFVEPLELIRQMLKMKLPSETTYSEKQKNKQTK
jgi:hypothetical protein